MRLSFAVLATLFVSLPSMATGAPVGDAMAAKNATVLAVMQDTVRRDTTTRRPPADSTRRPLADSARTPGDSLDPRPATLPSGLEQLDLRLDSRLEAKGERVRNERCATSQLFVSTFSCGGSFQPSFDFQFNLLTRGTVGERIHVDVDYDTQREFDASNNISIRYEGKDSELFRRVEIGNVSFAPPTSRFITAGIPSGNYGIQAMGRVGPMRFAAIAAQQKGNVIRDIAFVVGDRTVQRQDREIEDYQIEPRRFFFTVDPERFGSRYPNVDILNARLMTEVASALPDSIRPSKVFVYRLLLGGQPRNPNGPQFRLIGDPTSQRGQVYELLRERVDYYIDPSLLWFALVTPLNLDNERLVVAYTVRLNGRDTTIATTGGTPDLEFVGTRDQWANLVWDPRLRPEQPAFRREIRSVYRVGGSDVRRQTVDVRIVTGASRDQEKPAGGDADTYLELFGLAQATNSSRFDADNRLWPRPHDPNSVIVAGSGAEQIIRDYFLVFPSLRPFARNGLAGALANPANDTIYRTPGEYLYSPEHPQSFYRIRVAYDAALGDDAGAIALNTVQLRPGSERILLDGRPLLRGVDYTIDYELGRVTFARPDTLFPFPRTVRVRYEENPLFTSIPTSIFGVTTQFAGPNGSLDFTAISQSQRTTFTRPPLGYEPASSLVAGMSGAFTFDASPLARALARILPFTDSIRGPARIELQGEFAASRPQANSKGQAYIESFDGEAGVQIPLSDLSWYYGSQPALGERLPSRFGAASLDLQRASTLAWQTNGTDRNGDEVRFTIEQIDPFTNIVGSGFAAPETMLWLTLYPLHIGGLRDPASGEYRWQVGDRMPGRRWRSIRTSLGPSGADLSRVETIEFWTLVDTGATRAATNPILVFDFGDVSENSVVFAPETLVVGARPQVPGDSAYAGKQLQGFDRLDSERDPFSRAFNVDVNDAGLPGDVVDTLVVVAGATARSDTAVRVCVRGDIRRRALGDSRTNCTVGNSRLDEEDLDADQVLNFGSDRRNDERVRRYIVDLSRREGIDRLGRCGAQVNDVNGSRPPGSTLCWVHYRIPFDAADDSINGGPPIRRIQSLRVTVLSAEGAGDEAFLTAPIARLRLVGAPWLTRADRPLRGIAGTAEEPGAGYVIAGLIGTQDRDSLRGLVYEPPPGVSDQPDNLQAPFDPTRVLINERSLRLQAGGLATYDRAEAFYRFPEGQKSFMTYKELRVWARGRGNGWGEGGELQFFVKIGRDPNNFYLYRTPASAGATRAAWQPEVRVRFDRFFALRSRLLNAYSSRSADSLACTGADSALIVRSGLPAATFVSRYAACADGYVVYTTDPAVTPPNLAAVQELAVGIVRVDSATGASPLLPADTMEVWVDDVRLADVANETGFAGQIGLAVALGDVMTVRVGATRRDPHFRQLGEAPTFLTTNDLELSTTVRLDRLLPSEIAGGLALPFSVSHTSAAIDPLFLSQSDIAGDGVRGVRTPRTSLTTYALSVRRAAPLVGPWYAPLVNQLGLTGTYTALGNRTEYQTGRGRSFNLGVDLLVTSSGVGSGNGGGEVRPPDARLSAPAFRLPTRLSFSGQATGSINLRPTIFRLTSGLARSTDRRSSFLKPATALDDTALVATGESHLWRNASALELQPVRDLTARADVLVLRDLRDYGGATPNASAAAAERGSFLGLDAGLERERQITSSITYAPVVAGWLRPRVDIGTSYSLLRDPNAPPIAVGGNATAPRVPLRLGNTRGVTVGAAMDVARAGARYAGTTSLLARLASFLQPIDVALNRGILTAYEGASVAPGLGFQLGLGSIDAFRGLRGSLANTAGATTDISLGGGLNLPLDISVTNRAQRTFTRTWARRLATDQTTIDGEGVVSPDLTVRWSPRAPLFGGVLKSAGVNGRLLHTRQSVMIPSVILGAPSETRAIRVRTYPLNAAITWEPGEVTTTAGYAYSTRVDSLPGSVTNGSTNELSADIGRTFDVPSSWNLRSGLRARIGFQRAHTQSYVQNVFAAGRRSRLTDSGRQAFTLNADTDVAENMTFSMQGSRIVTFDRNFNRRLSQTVVTAVLQMKFFAGDLR